MSMVAAIFKTAQKEPGDGKQHHRHGDLRDHQQIAQGDAAAGARECILSFKRVGEQWPRSGPGRGDAQQDSADQR